MAVFNKTIRVALVLLGLCPALASAELAVDGERLQHAVSTVDDLPDGRARIFLEDRMQAAGLMTWSDARGNLVGEHDGRWPLPPLLVEAPLAAPAAALAAIEVAQSLRDNGSVLRHPLIIRAVNVCRQAQDPAPGDAPAALQLWLTSGGEIGQDGTHSMPAESCAEDSARPALKDEWVAAANALLNALLAADRRAADDQVRRR